MGAWLRRRPCPLEAPDVDEVPEVDRAWVTIVWNDPVNLMSYVTWVFQKLFGYSKEKAEQLMLGRASRGPGDRVQRAARADGVRRDPPARLRPVGDGRPAMTMFRRSGAGVRGAGSPARRPRCCASAWPSWPPCCRTDPDPDDPAVERLFPDVYPEDPAEAAEFRRFTEADLKAAKLDQAKTVLSDLLEAGGEVRARRRGGRPVAAGAHRRTAGAGHPARRDGRHRHRGRARRGGACATRPRPGSVSCPSTRT